MLGAMRHLISNYGSLAPAVHIVFGGSAPHSSHSPIRRFSQDEASSARHSSSDPDRAGKHEEFERGNHNAAILMDRIGDAFWALLGLAGLGGPIVDRRSMFGDDPRHDPYALDFDLIDPPHR